MIKFDGDRLVAMTVLCTACSIIAAVVAPWFPFPEAAAWPWLGASLFCHFFYKVGLVRAYQHGNFGQVYPIARGTAPLLVTLWAFVFFDQEFGRMDMLAVLLLTSGIISLSFIRTANGQLPGRAPVLYALMTAFFISGYTIVDGMAVQRIENLHSYVIWLFILDSLPFLALSLHVHRRETLRMFKRKWLLALAGGGMSIGAYWLVVWAMSFGSVPLVAALRETSVLFAALIAFLLLKEPVGVRSVASAVVVAGGIVLLKM